MLQQQTVWLYSHTIMVPPPTMERMIQKYFCERISRTVNCRLMRFFITLSVALIIAIMVSNRKGRWTNNSVAKYSFMKSSAGKGRYYIRLTDDISYETAGDLRLFNALCHSACFYLQYTQGWAWRRTVGSF